MDRNTARLERYRGRARMHWKKARGHGDKKLRQFHAECASTWQELAAIIADRSERGGTHGRLSRPEPRVTPAHSG